MLHSISCALCQELVKHMIKNLIICILTKTLSSPGIRILTRASFCLLVGLFKSGINSSIRGATDASKVVCACWYVGKLRK